MAHKRDRKQTSLFIRILIRLVFPLLFLTFAFTAIELTTQLSFLNKIYEIQSRASLQAMTRRLSSILQVSANFDNPYLLKAELQRAKEANQVSDLTLLDPLTRDTLYTDDLDGLSSDNLVAAERSLLEAREGKPPLLLIDKESQKLNAFIPVTSSVKERTYVAKLGFQLGSLKLALQKSMGTLTAMFLFILLAGFVIAGALSHSIVKPIQTLNQASRDILKGKLGQRVAIYTGDEIEELADTFNHMSTSLKEMKEQAEDSNPLTQLPGNNGIFHEIQKRIYERQKFVFFHIDLDRFKIFNDHYGLARGDECIKKTAGILKASVRAKGAQDDFVGHQGGDDFVIITRPNKARELAEEVIQHFDNEIVRSLYRKEDYERGYIFAPDRRKETEEGLVEKSKEETLTRFPLLAISLAGISNVKKDFADYFDCMSQAAPVKKEAKKTVKSSYLIKE